MWKKHILFIFIVLILSNRPAVSAQFNPTIFQKGQGKWEDINVPKTFTFSDTNTPECTLDLSKEFQSNFQYLRLKPDVEIFNYYDHPMIIPCSARLNKRTSIITRENIGYFFGKVDSEAKAFELVMYFHRGVLLTDKDSALALIRKCKETKVAKVSDAMPDLFEPRCQFDKKTGVYKVSFLMYELRNIFEAKYIVTTDGFIGYSLQNYVIGPVMVGGWPVGGVYDDMYKQYKKTSDAFEIPINGNMEDIAVNVMKNSALNKMGLVKARRESLRWILSFGDVDKDAPYIEELVKPENNVVDSKLRQQALDKIKIVRSDFYKKAKQGAMNRND
jgi:hypothetical protein